MFGRHSATALRTGAAEPTTGRQRPSSRSTTAGSPVARASPVRPISGSPCALDRARRDAEEAGARLRELSGTRWPDWHLAEISGLAGDHEDASNRLRIVCEWLEATEQLPHLATYLSFLGRSLCRLGRFDEAAPFAERARAIGKTIGAGGDSVPDDYLWRQVLARVLAHRGELAEAERYAREAVAGSEQSDSLDDQCLALWDLAEVLAAEIGRASCRER